MDPVRASIETAGGRIRGVEIRECEVTGEMDRLRSQLSDRVSWDEQIGAMDHLMALINGGILEFDAFMPNMTSMYSIFVAALRHKRAAVIRSACMVLALLARELGPKFAVIGEYVRPISSQIEHSEAGAHCEQLVLFVARKCQSREILAAILELCGAVSQRRKAVGAEALVIVTTTWNGRAVGTNWMRLLPVLAKLTTNKSTEIQVLAKKAVDGLERISPEKASEFRAKYQKACRQTATTRQNVRAAYQKHVSVPFVKGQEKGFANQVRDLVETGKGNEIDVDSIRSNLLTCCWHPSSTVVIVALTALQDLLSLRPDEFINDLTPIVNLLVFRAGSQSPRCASKASAILRGLTTTFDPSLIRASYLAADPSENLLRHVVETYEESEFTLRIAFLCLEVATSEASEIIRNMHESDPAGFQLIVDTFCVDQFRVLRMLIPDLAVYQAEPITIPPITEDNEAVILEIVNSEQWVVARSTVLMQIDEAITKDDPFAIRLAQKVMRATGFEEFRLLLRGMITATTGKWGRLAEALLTSMTHSVDGRDILVALRPCLKYQSIPLLQRTLALEASLIASMSKRDVKTILSNLLDDLAPLSTHKSQSVRKATVACLAELRSIVGSTMDVSMTRFDDVSRNAVSVALSLKDGHAGRATLSRRIVM